MSWTKILEDQCVIIAIRPASSIKNELVLSLEGHLSPTTTRRSVMKNQEANNVLPQILELQRQAREEIKNGSVELGKALLKKAQELIDELDKKKQNKNSNNKGNKDKAA